MYLTTYGIDKAIEEYCLGIVDVIPDNVSNGCYISSCKRLDCDSMRFAVVEVDFFYASLNIHSKSFELLMYQQDLNRIDVVRSYDNSKSCFTAFNAVKFINH